VLDVLSGTTDNVDLLDTIRAQVGDDPHDWLPVFHEQLAKRRAASARMSSSMSRLAGGVK
jgi:type IV secretion system protein VirB4